MNQTPDAGNPFQPLAAAGYPRLLPVIPPGAQISPHSKYLSKRVGTASDPRGKAPGVLNGDGGWHGINFTKVQSSPELIQAWHEMGAGCGVRTGSGLAALDVDTIDGPTAARAVGIIEQELGLVLAKRYGRRPKVLMPIRVLGEFGYQNVKFLTPAEQDRLRPGLVELLAEGRHFVAAGIHPVTGRPYEWPDGIPAYDDLPVVAASALERLFARLALELGAISHTSATSVDREAVNQAALRSPVEQVRAAVEATPNTTDAFPSRDDWLQMGYAIKAACGPENEHEALEIWSGWSDRWDEGENDRDELEANWDRMKPPYGVGAGWIFDRAHRVGGWLGEADRWFSPLPALPPEAQDQLCENPFLASARASAGEDVYETLTVADIVNRPPPEFLIDRWLPAVSMGFLYSEPGAGKSFLALDQSLTLALALRQWHGHPVQLGAGVAGGGAVAPLVIYIAAEGSFGFRNRVKAWIQTRRAQGAIGQEICENAFGNFRLIERTIDFMDEADIGRLQRTVRGLLQTVGAGGGALGGGRCALVVVDTVSRAMPGADENLQKEMTLFVRACDRVKEEFRCCVLGVHHAGKNGDMRGSTVLRGAGDFVFKLERARGATRGRVLCEKQKDGEDGWAEGLVLERVVLPDGETSLVPSVVPLDGATGGVDAVTAGEIVEAMQRAWDEGAPWSDAPQTRKEGRFAGEIMLRRYGVESEDALNALELWKRIGIIRMEIFDPHSKRRGLKVIGQLVSPEGGEALTKPLRSSVLD